jgi:hypothetical protein
LFHWILWMYQRHVAYARTQSKCTYERMYRCMRMYAHGEARAQATRRSPNLQSWGSTKTSSQFQRVDVPRTRAVPQFLDTGILNALGSFRTGWALGVRLPRPPSRAAAAGRGPRCPSPDGSLPAAGSPKSSPGTTPCRLAPYSFFLAAAFHLGTLEPAATFSGRADVL